MTLIRIPKNGRFNLKKKKTRLFRTYFYSWWRHVTRLQIAIHNRTIFDNFNVMRTCLYHLSSALYASVKPQTLDKEFV